MATRAILVLPKDTCYNYKTEIVQKDIEHFVHTWIDWMQQFTLPIYCFAEDCLALRLLSGEGDINWLSVLGDTDTAFFTGGMVEVPEEYKSIKPRRVSEAIIKGAEKAVPITSLRGLSPQDFRSKRVRILRNRIRHACNAVLKDTALIVCIENGDGYCNLPEPELGDGTLQVIADLKTSVVRYYLGGVPLNKENFEVAIRRMYARDL